MQESEGARHEVDSGSVSTYHHRVARGFVKTSCFLVSA